MRLRRTVVAILLTAASAAVAAPPTDAEFHGGNFRMPPPSVERMAMHNIVAELLSQQTGRPASEIASLLETAPPPKIAEQLGLDEEAVKALFDTARLTLIERAAGAGLISSEQAEKLRTMPRLEQRFRSGTSR